MPRNVHPLTVVQLYTDYLNGLVNGLFSDSRLVSLKGPAPSLRVIACFQDGAFKSIEFGPAAHLFFHQLVEVIERPGGQQVQVQSYTYIFGLSPDREDQSAWLFRYEYERAGNPDKPHAHLHVNGTHGTGQFDYDKLHFPTGRISVEQVFAHVVLEHDVPMRVSKAEAVDRLRESHAGFYERRTDLRLDPQLFP